MYPRSWFKSDVDVCVGDVVLFLKSEQEFDQQYQYGPLRGAGMIEFVL